MSYMKSVLLAGIAAAFIHTGAMAGEDAGLYSWAKKANTAVDKTMKYPVSAIRRGQSGSSVFTVTVDRDGDVVASELSRRTGDKALLSAAERVVEKTNFPALPEGYDSEEMTFRLHLNYAIASSGLEKRMMMRRTQVSSEEISSGTPIVGRIEILAAADE